MTFGKIPDRIEVLNLKLLSKIITTLTEITRYIALTAMALMMFFITYAVICRMLFTPIMGDIEIVQLGMVVLIMCGLAYTQHAGGHIAIGLIVDKLNPKIQQSLDVLASLLTVIITFVIGYIYIFVALNHKNHMQLSTNLLDVPYYLFDFVIVLGFVMWGLEALLKLGSSILLIFQPNSDKEREIT